MFKKSLVISALLTVIFNISYANNEVDWYLAGKKSVANNQTKAYLDADKNLANSLLQPYLRYHFYKKNINTADSAEVFSFIKNNPQRAFIALLNHDFFNTQLKRNNLDFILQKAPDESTQFIRCVHYAAQINKDSKAFNPQAFEHDWRTQKALPSICNTVEAFWLKSYATKTEIKQKTNELMETLHLKKAGTLIPYLETADQQYFNFFIRLLNNPSTLLNQKQHYKNASKFYRLAVIQWGRKDSTSALNGLEFVQKNSLVNDHDYKAIRNQLAVFQAGRKDAVAPLARIDAIPQNEQTDDLKLWGFRLNVEKNECQRAVNFLTRLSEEAKAEPTWIYWTGRMYQCLNDQANANLYYEKIATHTSFYGFLAADHLNRSYSVLSQMVNAKSNQAEPLTDQRYNTALLLLAANENGFARSEWSNAGSSASASQKHSASVKAFNLGYYDLSLRAAASARMPGGLHLRYPMAYPTEIAKYANKYQFPRSIIWGLTRQESLFQADVKSHAEAYGLMQLLIPTAQKMANQLGEKRQSLLDPDANIRYGTAYLDYVSTLVGRSWPFVLASYNAGPHKVKVWSENPPADIVLWIEMIPYKETREYVKTVLENAVIYNYQQNNPVKVSDYLVPF